MIVWVFGGTAVGKKRFIQRAANRETRPKYLGIGGALTPFWIEDGPLTNDLVTAGIRGHVAVRWQWGRDETLESICTHHPQVGHAIVVLSVSLMTQLSRIALREGCLKWDAANIHGEQLNMVERVHELSARFRIPVFYVDATNDEYALRKKIG